MKETKAVETPEQKIVEIKKDIIVIEKQSQKVAIVNSEADVQKATEFLGQLKGRFDRVEQLRKFFVEEPTRHIAKVNKMFREQKEPLDVMLRKVKRAVGDYRMEEDRKAQAEEDRLQKLRDAKNKRREEKGKEPDLTPTPIVEKPKATVETESGKSTAKKVWKFEVEDVQKLPLDIRKAILILANEKGIVDTIVRGQVRNGVREMEGVKIFEDYDVNVSAR